MSRGGLAGSGGSRGGGGGGLGKSAAAGVRAIANVLGITRQEVSQFTTQQVRNEPLPLYPPLGRDPLPLEETKELVFMTDTKQEFLQRFRDSPFYHKRTGKRDVRRYTDKYRLMVKEPFEPNWDRLPAELNWKATAKAGHRQRAAALKRARLDENALLERLGQKEQLKSKEEADEDEPAPGGATEGQDDEDEEGGGRARKPTNEDEEEVEYSDEDYMAEGANDYVDTYFDGGDDYDPYGDGLEEEGVY